MTVNMNKFADEVALREGKQHAVNIADVKEILKITLTMLAELNEEDLTELLSRYRRQE